MSTTPYEMTEAEREHAENVDVERRTVHNALANLDSALTTIRQAHGRMVSNQIYDIEVVEGRAAQVIPAALAQIEVALAALRAVTPQPGA